MTLQSSGQMNFTDIQTEFGGTNPISLDEYYSAASGLPSSGQISMNQFYGKSAGWERTLTVGHVNDLGFAGSIATNMTGFCTRDWTVNGQRFIPPTPQGSFSANNTFINGSAIINMMFKVDYEIKATAEASFNLTIAGNHSNSDSTWRQITMDGLSSQSLVLNRSSMAFIGEEFPVAGGYPPIPYATTWKLSLTSGTDMTYLSSMFRTTSTATANNSLGIGRIPVNMVSNWTLGRQITVKAYN